MQTRYGQRSSRKPPVKTPMPPSLVSELFLSPPLLSVGSMSLRRLSPVGPPAIGRVRLAILALGTELAQVVDFVRLGVGIRAA